MGLRFLHFADERRMGDWLEECLSEAFENQGAVALEIVPTLPAGFEWKWGRAEVLREVSLDLASSDGRGAAPCDMLLAVDAESASGDTLSINLLIELKNRPIKPADFGQLARYMPAVVEGEIFAPGRPDLVFGALIGTGWCHESKVLAALIPGVQAFGTELCTNRIRLDPLGGHWFYDTDTIPTGVKRLVALEGGQE